MTRPIAELRSQRWFAPNDFRSFGHRQRLQQTGLRREDFMGRPVIGIVNTWSDISPCHAHLRERAESVRRGILAAGGHPIEMPALSLGEVMVKPTTMMYRNFLVMECEELLRSHPIDGAARRAAWTPPSRVYARSYALLYQQHVSQADRGCDFDFLEGKGAPEPPIF